MGLLCGDCWLACRRRKNTARIPIRFIGPCCRRRHPIGKGPETNRNEATHEVLRRKLNRLVRRTQGYSKSLAMLVDSLALVWLKQGWIQNACPC